MVTDERIRYLAGLPFYKVKYNLKLKTELKSTYEILFGEPLKLTCENCIQDGLDRLKLYLKLKNKKVMETMETTLFKFKDGIVLWVNAWGMHITNANLTTTIALNLLRLNPANIKNFEKYPENWSQMLVKTEVKAVGEEIKKDDIQPDSNPITEPEDVKEPLTVDLIINRYTKDEIVEKINELKPGTFPGSSASTKKIDLANILLSITKEI